MLLDRSDRLRGPSIPKPRPLGYDIGITLGMSQVRDYGMANAVSAVYRWTCEHAPTAVYSNIKVGPASWLASHALHRGWPLIVVVFERQIANLPDRQIREAQEELIYRATEVIETPSVFERDRVLKERAGRLLTIEDFGLGQGSDQKEAS